MVNSTVYGARQTSADCVDRRTTAIAFSRMHFVIYCFAFFAGTHCVKLAKCIHFGHFNVTKAELHLIIGSMLSYVSVLVLPQLMVHFRVDV